MFSMRQWISQRLFVGLVGLGHIYEDIGLEFLDHVRVRETACGGSTME